MRNAFSGYTYHEQIVRLFIAKMDVERQISKIEIEADTYDKFDDLVVLFPDLTIQIQIKDFLNVKQIIVSKDNIKINGERYALSKNLNVVFFRSYDFTPNSEILGFPSYCTDGVHIVSLDRQEADTAINTLYQDNYARLGEINEFFNELKDKRIWHISRESLPSIDIYNTQLMEKSVDIGVKLLKDVHLIHVEGKPGVGKSHYVTLIANQFRKNILYRFWVSNQDPHYHERLKFNNFIQDLSKQLFSDRIERSVEAVLIGLKDKKKLLIIDGLDHVENYFSVDLEKYINFIQDASLICQVIVFSRPLVEKLSWYKQILENWTSSQTGKVLEELFNLEDYKIKQQIFELTQGYPILVKFLAEHFKRHLELPVLNAINTIDDYYNQIITRQKSKRALSLFLCTKSFLMQSELDMFLGVEVEYLREFVTEHSYLFEQRLNRISLIHDSLNTYLRKFGTGYQELNLRVSQLVIDSIKAFEIRFLSRFSLFDIKLEDRQSVLRLYSSISIYCRCIEGCVDVEAIRIFYQQLKIVLSESDENTLSLVQYYDLSLIENLIVRDHFSAQYGFYHVFVKALVSNGYSVEDITSSGYLFGMFYFSETKNPVLLANSADRDMYSTDNFFTQLELEIEKESLYFFKYKKPLTDKQVSKILANRSSFRERLTYVLMNIYMHKLEYRENKILSDIVRFLINGDHKNAKALLERYVISNNQEDYTAGWIIKDVEELIRNLGYTIEGGENVLLDLTLEELIEQYKAKGSFELYNLVYSYLRLAVHQNRSIDVQNIFNFYTKYYNRRDYSLFSTPLALYTLEKRGILTRKSCIQLISHMQSISEKEYRLLLLDFISYYPPDIIPFIEDNFDLENLVIEWFLLEPKYIDQFSKLLFENAMNKQFDDYRYSRELEFHFVENILDSKWLPQFTDNLKWTGIRIRVPENSTQSKRLTNLKIAIVNEKAHIDQSEQKVDRNDRWKKGVLDMENISYIKDENISVVELAKYLDHRGSSLENSSVFNLYPKSLVIDNLHHILFNAMTAKTSSGMFYSALYFWPGTALDLLSTYADDRDFRYAAKSYITFMKLSKFDF